MSDLTISLLAKISFFQFYEKILHDSHGHLSNPVLGLSISGGYPGHSVKFLASALIYCAFTFIVLREIQKEKSSFILFLSF